VVGTKTLKIPKLPDSPFQELKWLYLPDTYFHAYKTGPEKNIAKGETLKCPDVQ
jgi:hypothetical protein